MFYTSSEGFAKSKKIYDCIIYASCCANRQQQQALCTDCM